MNTLFGIFLVVIVVFAGALLGICFGALAGWIAGWFFSTTLIALAHLLGLTAPYQVGAAAGFVGGFFHSSPSVTAKS